MAAPAAQLLLFVESEDLYLNLISVLALPPPPLVSETRMLLPHAAYSWAVNATAFPILTLLAVGHASTGIDLLARAERDEVPLILELLTQKACPGSVLFLLQSQALGLIASSGIALAVAATPDEERTRALPLALAAAAAVGLRQPQLCTAPPATVVLRCGTLLCAFAANWRASPRPGRAPAAHQRRRVAAAGRIVLGVGLAAVAAPSACAGRGFACLGQTRLSLARALRCAAAQLLPLGASCLELSRTAPTPSRSHRLLASAVAVGSGAQLALLLGPHAHALHRGARWAMVLMHAASSAAAAAAATGGFRNRRCVIPTKEL